jgi:hypothetical protein
MRAALASYTQLRVNVHGGMQKMYERPMERVSAAGAKRIRVAGRVGISLGAEGQSARLVGRRHRHQKLRDLPGIM